MPLKKDSCIGYALEAGLLVFIGASGVALYGFRNNLSDVVKPALAVSSVGIVCAFVLAWKLERSSSKQNILQTEKSETVKENLKDAYLGFCRAGISIGNRQILILPNTTFDIDSHYHGSLKLFEQELYKGLKNVYFWKEIEHSSSKPLSNHSQILCRMERDFSNVLADLLKTLETQYSSPYLSHPCKGCCQLDVLEVIRAHLSENAIQVTNFGKSQKFEKQQGLKPKGMEESAENSLKIESEDEQDLMKVHKPMIAIEKVEQQTDSSDCIIKEAELDTESPSTSNAADFENSIRRTIFQETIIDSIESDNEQTSRKIEIPLITIE